MGSFPLFFSPFSIIHFSPCSEPVFLNIPIEEGFLATGVVSPKSFHPRISVSTSFFVLPSWWFVSLPNLCTHTLRILIIQNPFLIRSIISDERWKNLFSPVPTACHLWSMLFRSEPLHDILGFAFPLHDLIISYLKLFRIVFILFCLVFTASPKCLFDRFVNF